MSERELSGESDAPEVYGLRHECTDRNCHVAAFVATLRTKVHPPDDCGLRDCPRCTGAAERILLDLRDATSPPAQPGADQ